MASLLTVLTGAILLIWPALVNGYPLVFSDTGGFLEQALMPDMGWDKPWIYGPFLTPFHGRVTLWPAVVMQGTLLSAMLWMAQAALDRPRKGMHLLLCAGLAVGTAAPWFAALLMPDFLAPVCVLGLFVLAFGPGRVGVWGLVWVGVATSIAIAAHLAHLVLAAGCIAALAAMRWRSGVPHGLAPLAAALAMLVGSNIVGNGVVAVSPYGSVFALARMVGDGPARDLIDKVCPAAKYRLCAWKGRLPSDSDEFLWDPHGPVWADGFGPIRFAPEADALVRATVLSEPLGVLVAATAKHGAAVGRACSVGDALIADHLEIAVRARLRTYFPAAEVSAVRCRVAGAGGFARGRGAVRRRCIWRCCWLGWG